MVSSSLFILKQWIFGPSMHIYLASRPNKWRSVPMHNHFFLLVKSNIYVIYCVLKKFRMNVSTFFLLSCECAFLVETVILTITSVIRRKMTLTHFFQLLEYYFICFSLKCPQLSSSNKKSLIKKISLTSSQQA